MSRVSPDTKRAAAREVNACRALGGPVQQTAERLARQLLVHPRTVLRWADHQGLNTGRRRETLTRAELVEIARHQGCVRSAHASLRADGRTELSYSQFHRRLLATDTDFRLAVTQGLGAAMQAGLYNVQEGEYRRGDVFGFDHTEIPVWVWNPLEAEPRKIWVSLCLDWSTGLVFRPVFTEGVGVRGDPNTSSVIALIASVLIGQELAGTIVGGTPGILTFDNALAHLADACANGFAATPIRAHVIRKGSPWENGPSENAIGVIEKRVWRPLPGYTHHLGTRFATLPWTKEDLLTPEELMARTVEGIEKLNTEAPMSRHQGKTRLEAWRADPLLPTFAEPTLVRHHFLNSSRASYKVTKNGVHFHGIWYVHPALHGKVGRVVGVRHLPTDPSFIDIYLGGEFLCSATPTAQLSREQRSRLAKTRRNRVASADRIVKKGAKIAAGEAARDAERSAFAGGADANDADRELGRYLRLIEGERDG